MSLIALKFVAAGMVAVGLLCLALAIGAGWDLNRRRRSVTAMRGGSPRLHSTPSRSSDEAASQPGGEF